MTTVATRSRTDTSIDVIRELLKTDRAIGELERLTRERIVRAHEEWPAKGYSFDLAAGERVVRFVEEYCRHYKGEWAGPNEIRAVAKGDSP